MATVAVHDSASDLLRLLGVPAAGGPMGRSLPGLRGMGHDRELRGRGSRDRVARPDARGILRGSSRVSHRDPGSGSGARRRSRPGLGGPPGGRAGDRQVHPAAAGRSARLADGRARVPARVRRGVPRAGRGPVAAARRGGRRASRFAPGRDLAHRAGDRRASGRPSSWRWTPSRPCAIRPPPRCRAAWPRSGSARTPSSGWPRRRASRS